MKTESFSDEYIQTTNMSTSISKSAWDIEICTYKNDEYLIHLYKRNGTLRRNV